MTTDEARRVAKATAPDWTDMSALSAFGAGFPVDFAALVENIDDVVAAHDENYCCDDCTLLNEMAEIKVYAIAYRSDASVFTQEV
jgi:hypothetical protein